MPDAAKKAKPCQCGKRQRPHYWHLYQTRQWRRAAKSFLARPENTLCKCGKPATQVDHITPHKGNLELFWNQENWQPICQSCHSKKSATEKHR